jgi:hypothetical protein
MATVMTYSPSEVKIVIAGYTLPGILSLNVVVDQPLFKSVRGIRGQVARVRNTNLSGTLTVVLQQTSQGNTVLEDIAQLDLKHGNGQFRLTLTGQENKTQLDCELAYILGFADIKYSNAFEDRSWSIALPAIVLPDVATNVARLGSILDRGSEYFDELKGQAIEYATPAIDSVTGFFS